MWHVIAGVFYRQEPSLYCSTFQGCESPSNHWKPSTMPRTKAKLRPPMIPPCVQPQALQAMLIYWQKQGPLLRESMLVWTLLKQDIPLFTGAHLSKVMARKIWMPQKSNRDYKAIICLLSHWHFHHSSDRGSVAYFSQAVQMKGCYH